MAHPGDKYQYGINTDVLGYVVEVVADMPFDGFTKVRILDPLQMRDTTFKAPADKLGRLAKTYTVKEGKQAEFRSEEFLKYGDAPFGAWVFIPPTGITRASAKSPQRRAAQWRSHPEPEDSRADDG